MWSTRSAQVVVGAMFALAVGCSSGSDGAAGPAGPAGAQGTPGTNGSPGATGATGPSGVPDGGFPIPGAGTINATVTAAKTSKALGGTTITCEPGALKVTTASDGTYSFKNLPAGAYTLTFERTGYVTKTVAGVGVSAIGPTNVAVGLDTDAKTDAPAVTLGDNLLAGFGANVTLAATATVTDTDASALTYAWKQTGGRPVTFTGDGTSSISFTTLAIADVRPQATGKALGRFGGMGFDPDETGNYVFQLTVSDPEGHATTVTAHVMATAPGTGLRNVPIGLPAWFQGDTESADGGAQTTWSWQLDTTNAAGSTATLSNATSQFPSFTPDQVGSYKLTETVANKSMTVYAGKWIGESAGATGLCTGCHSGSTAIPWVPGSAPPDEFTPWAGTKHARAFSDYIDGKFGQEFGPSCLGCHALGDSPLASNNGFDDVAKAQNWSFPATLQPGNWQSMQQSYPAVAQLANVQCESCHGPQNSPAHVADNPARISFSNEVCMSCHQEAPFDYQGGQWQTSRHSNLDLAVEVATADGEGITAQHCGRCHSAEGYAQYAQQLAAGYTGYLTSDGKPAAFAAGPDGGTVQTNAATLASLTALGLTKADVHPQACAACHDPHDAKNPYQLRLYGSAPGGLPNGQISISGVGAGMVCMACHNTRNGETDDSTAASLSATAAIGRGPHDGPQTDVLFGVNAYFMPLSNPSPHLAVKDTCVGCHHDVPTADQAAAGQATNHAFKTDLTICGKCHGDGQGGSLVDGAALQAGVKAQMLALDQLVFTKAASAMAAAITANGTITVSALDTATGNYLCAAPGTGTPTFKLSSAPAAASITEVQPVAEWRSLNTLWFPMASLAGTSECTATGATAATTYDGRAPIQVALSSVKAGSPLAPIFVANATLTKAISNEALLHNDQTWGIHNLPFFQAVITNTTAQLKALP